MGLLSQSINFLHQKPLSQSEWSDWIGEWSDWTVGELGWTSTADSWSTELVDSDSLSVLWIGVVGLDLGGDGFAFGCRFFGFFAGFLSETVGFFRFLAGNFFRTGESSLNNNLEIAENMTL